MDVWSGPTGLGALRRERIAYKRVLHLVIMALNFAHAECPLKSITFLRRRPGAVHRLVYDRILALIKAGGPGQSLDLVGSGRKSFQLDARHRELLEALQGLGLSEASKYHSASSGQKVPVVNDVDELIPYRALDASRVALTGTGSWDCTPYLSDLLYLPFVEPRINMFDVVPPQGSYPDVRGCDGKEEMELCLVWDARRLLRIFPAELGPQQLFRYTRVFGNFKNDKVDRQIGDRRGQNFCEGRIAGPSRTLPVMTTLLQLCPVRFEEVLVGSVTDRKDFYHQFAISDEKASLNAIFPLFRLSDFEATAAFEEFMEKFPIKKRKRDRTSSGDHLHGSPSSILVGEEMDVVACFGSVFQGDHLGVEIATDSHANLLADAGLLHPLSRLRSDLPLADDLVAEGLVIDDFFSISRESLSEEVGAWESSRSVGSLRRAKAVYEREGLIGSDEKDIVGALQFKVCGAEIDSSVQSARRGVVSAAAPRQKRFSLALLSAQVSSLPYTSDALHACLLGSWISVLMMRRQIFSVMNEVFHVVPAMQLDTDSPVLRPLSRAAAQEFALLACLAPIAVSNLAVPFSDHLYATDASMEKGGVVKARCSEKVLRALWRSADKKGSSVPMSSRAAHLLSEYESTHEILPSQEGSWQQKQTEIQEVDRPLGLSFQFLEVCGGSGVVTAELVKLGVICGPVFDLSFSNKYDLRDKRIVEWIVHMMEQGRLDSFLVAPPCTSFSPAAFPSVRSYSCPRGYDQLNPKVILGNILAFVALTLLFCALRLGVCGVGEQPRRSKMRWLQEWRRLLELGATECSVASCAHGSPHQKEFGLIGANVSLKKIARRCSRDHTHIPIQGKYTRPSAVYCPGLAVAFADLFKENIERRQSYFEQCDVNVQGLENVLANDMCVVLDWQDVDDWRWRRPSHINILEGKAILRLFSLIARGGGDVRLPFLCDSHVARSCFAKGRSASGSLRFLLKQAAAICLAFGIYPGGIFAPTRLNPADCPTRDIEFPDPVDFSICSGLCAGGLRALAAISGLRRWAANWVRLVLLLSGRAISHHFDYEDSWRRHAQIPFAPGGWTFDFDSTLGFPGEGPASFLSPFLIWLFLLAFFALPPAGDCSPLSPGLALSLFTIISFVGCPCVIGAPRGGRNGDEERKVSRAGIVLHDGRRVTPATATNRQLLFDAFSRWLEEDGENPSVLIFSSPPNLDLLNVKLCEYGRQLFSAGKPLYHYCETLNALTSARPVIRRSLQQAWDLAFIWGSHEPSEHHVAMPFQILVAVIATAWSWGWSREASLFALAWGALLRIGEIFDAFRGDLILPSDVGFTIDYALLKIREPKTRYRSARHQAGKVEQYDLIEIVRLGLEKLRPDEPLWHLSGSTLRSRLTRILSTLGLPHLPTHVPKALSLASLRPGGATHLISVSESAEMVRRRGRWASFRTMEMYLQEVAASTYLNDI